MSLASSFLGASSSSLPLPLFFAPPLAVLELRGGRRHTTRTCTCLHGPHARPQRVGGGVLERLPGQQHRLLPDDPGPATSSTRSSPSVIIHRLRLSCTIFAVWFARRCTRRSTGRSRPAPARHVRGHHADVDPLRVTSRANFNGGAGRGSRDATRSLRRAASRTSPRRSPSPVAASPRGVRPSRASLSSSPKRGELKSQLAAASIEVRSLSCGWPCPRPRACAGRRRPPRTFRDG